MTGGRPTSPERLVLAALAVDPALGTVVLDAPAARFAERVADLSAWLPPDRGPLPVPSTLRPADLTGAEPGGRSFLDRAAGRIVALAHGEGIEPASRALLEQAPGVGLVAAWRRRGGAPPPWPALFPAAGEDDDPVAALRARLTGAPSRPPLDLEGARRRLGTVVVEPSAWRRLPVVAAALAPGVLGVGDALYLRAVRLLIAWAALDERPAVAGADVDRLAEVFEVAPVEPTVRRPADAPRPPSRSTGAEADDGSVEPVALPPLPGELPPVAAGRRDPGPSGRRGRVLRHIARSNRREGIDVAATLRRALPRQRLRGRAPGQPPVLTADDLRVAVRRQRTGTTHFVVLDASGSMGGRALALGRGAALALLESAYRTRERVGLVVVGGGRVRLAATPTRAPERLRRLVLRERAGGGTPLPAALALVADRVRRTAGPASVLLVTDGRGNLTLDGRRDADAALAEAGRLIDALGRLGCRTAVLARRSERRAARFAAACRVPVLAVHPIDGRVR